MVERLTTKRRVIVVSTFMEIPCFLRLPGKIGERFSGVFQFERSLGDDLMEVSLVGANLQILIPWLPCQGRFTIYDAVILETEPLFLSLDDQSIYVPHEGCSDSFQVKEVCAGIGGLGIGATLMGIPVTAVLDCSSLACAHLRLNQSGKGNILCRDLEDDSAKGALHLLGGTQNSILAAGFPCQPHSIQGQRAGFQDPRHQVFIEVLRTAYLHGAVGVVLECTPQAQFDQG